MNRIIELNKKIRELQTEIEQEKQKSTLAIGTSVKKARKQNEMNQEDLAEMVGISRTQVTNIELRNSLPSMKHFIALCMALDVEPNIMLGWHSE